MTTIQELKTRLGRIGPEEEDPYKRVIGKPGINIKKRLQELKEDPDGPFTLTRNEFSKFDEEFAKGIPETRVEGFAKYVDTKVIGRTPEGKYETTDEPVNVDESIMNMKPGTSQLSEDLEDLRIKRKLLKDRGQGESFKEVFSRKFGAPYMNKNPAGEELKFNDFSQGVISRDLAKKLAKLKKRTHNAKQKLAAIHPVDAEAPKVSINPEHGKTIADAYDNMKHDPNHPAVKAAYSALINETKQQFTDLMSKGLKIDKIKPGTNPYPSSREMHDDIERNNHLYYFPTEEGYGAAEQSKNHPMLSETEFKHEDKPLLANDVFRIVHDVNGHHKGAKSGFGPKGEHQAYLTHKKMYSPLANKALFTETAGQNNWVNFGPHGEKNRADPKNTIYAEQKAGLLPESIINGVYHNA